MNDFFINKPNNIVASNLTTHILSNNKALDYHKTLSVYESTPLISLPNLADKFGVGSVHVKDESHRFGLNAFKGLGASYAIFKILEQRNVDTFCTATDGNHGRAVAWASKIAQKKAVIFVPKDTTESRMKAIENEGATVIKIDGNYDETCNFAEKTSRKEGWQLVQDTAWENYEDIPAQIMAGYTTHFQELEQSLHSPLVPKVDLVFLQAGVGSWAAAAVWYYLNRYGNNRPKIVIVEPRQADGILSSFKAGKRVNPVCTFKTIMAGLNCGIPSSSAWDIIKNGADVSIKVSDKYAKKAIREFYYPNKNDEKIIAGESGAGGLAGFIALMTLDKMETLRNTLGISSESNILFYNTEGATDPANFKKIVRLKP
jgi:diaminopropionate ammonia-lyase